MGRQEGAETGGQEEGKLGPFKEQVERECFQAAQPRPRIENGALCDEKKYHHQTFDHPLYSTRGG